MPVSTNRTSKRQKIVIVRNFPGWTVGPGLTEVLQPDTLHHCSSNREAKEIGILSLILAELQVDDCVEIYWWCSPLLYAFVCFFSDFRRTPDTLGHEMQTEGAKNGACCLRQSASPCALRFHAHGWQDSWRIGAYHQTTLDQESIADGCVNSSFDQIWWPIFQIYSNPLEVSRQDLAVLLGSSSPSSWHIQDHPSAASLWIGLFAPQISADSSRFAQTPLVRSFKLDQRGA